MMEGESLWVASAVLALSHSYLLKCISLMSDGARDGEAAGFTSFECPDLLVLRVY